MATEKLIKDIEALAQELINADPHDLQDIGKIYECFQSIGSESQKNNMTRVSAAAQRAADELKKAILDESIDREVLFVTLNEIVSNMQIATRPGGTDADMQDVSKAVSAGTDPNSAQPAIFRLPAYLDETIFNEFLIEQDTVLQNMESHILQLEKVRDPELFADLRRIFHTLKGESAVFELNDLERICHQTEDLMDGCGDKLPIDVLLQVKDWLKGVFDGLRTKGILYGVDNQLLSLLTNAAVKHLDEPSLSDETKGVGVSDDEQHMLHPDKAADEEPALSKSATIPVSGDIDLLTDFISEAQEHIDNIDNKPRILIDPPDQLDAQLQKYRQPLPAGLARK